MMLLLRWNRCVDGCPAQIEAGRLYLGGNRADVGTVTKHPTDGYSVRLRDYMVINAVDLTDLVRATLVHLEDSLPA